MLFNFSASNIPGYGGYEPRLPQVVKPKEKEKMTAISRRDYR